MWCCKLQHYITILILIRLVLSRVLCWLIRAIVDVKRNIPERQSWQEAFTGCFQWQWCFLYMCILNFVCHSEWPSWSFFCSFASPIEGAAYSKFHSASLHKSGQTGNKKQPGNVLSSGPNIIRQIRTASKCLSTNESWIHLHCFVLG